MRRDLKEGERDPKSEDKACCGVSWGVPGCHGVSLADLKWVQTLSARCSHRNLLRDKGTT